MLSDRFEYGKSMKLVKSLFSEKLLIKNMEMTDTKGFQVEGSVEAGEDMNELEDKVNYINSGLVDGVVSAQIKDVSIDTVKGWTFVMEVKLK